MTNREFIESWVRGYYSKERKGNLSIKDNVIYTYSEPLGVKIGRYILINRNKYSMTSSTHQSLLADAAGGFRSLEIPFDLLDKIDGYEGLAIHDVSANTGVISKNNKYYYAGLDEKNQYFLTELPGAAHTISGAQDLLRPEGVPLGAKRQGEFFFVEVDELPDDHPEPERKLTIKDTSHYATRGFEYEGDIYVKGTVRNSGHDMLRLYEDTNDRSWHKVFESERKESYSMDGTSSSVNYD